VPDTGENSTVGTLLLDTFDLMNIKLLDGTASTLYAIVRPNNTIMDFLGRSVAPMGTFFSISGDSSAVGVVGDGLLVSRLTEDVIAPSLDMLSIDMGNERIAMEFSEPIRLSSLVIPHLCLQGHADIDVATADANVTAIALLGLSSYFSGGSSPYQYCLTESASGSLLDGSVVRPTSYVEKNAGVLATASITVDLGDEDAAVLKLFPSLLGSLNTSYLSYEYFTAQDVAGNQLPSVSTRVARPFDAYVNDTIRPTLERFTFDLSDPSATRMTLDFSEPVFASSLEEFSLLNITVQSRFASRDGVSYRLTGGSIVSAYLDTVVVELLPEDVTSMKLIAGLIRTKQSTYLVVGDGMTSDLAGNPLEAYLDGAALSCFRYVPDRTPPQIISSRLDMDAGLLLFNFSEPIDLSTVDVTQLRVQLQYIPSDAIETSRYSLSSFSTVSDPTSLSTSLQIILATVDQDELKYRYPMTSAKAFTWLSYSSLFLKDVSMNGIEHVNRAQAIQITEYQADETLPQVTTYTLDMDRGLVTLVLSESVLPASILLDQLTLQDVATRRFGKLRTLSLPLPSSATTAGTATTTTTTTTTTTPGSVREREENAADGVEVGRRALSNTITVTLSVDALNDMKFDRIGATVASSLLSWTDNFVSDNAGNYLAPYWDAQEFGFTPREVDALIVDSTRPTLSRWFFHREAPTYSSDYSELVNPAAITMYLFFDEPVELRNMSLIEIYYTEATTPSSSSSASQIASFHTTGYSIVASVGNASSNSSSVMDNAGITYFNNNRKIAISLVNYCLDDAGEHVDVCSAAGADLFSYLNQSAPNNANPMDADSGSRSLTKNYFLTVSADAIRDFAYVPNGIAFIGQRAAPPEGSPDCSTCSEGEYVSQRCTATTDRVCSVCTSCGDGSDSPNTYTLEACSSHRDTVCAACKTCGYGSYVIAPCSSSRNTQCGVCGTCGPLQYISRACARGQDVVCNSCEMCSFDALEAEDERRMAEAEVDGRSGDATSRDPSTGAAVDAAATAINPVLPSARHQCEADKKYFVWKDAHCCFDRAGNNLPCDALDRRNVEITARNSRQKWNFRSR